MARLPKAFRSSNHETMNDYSSVPSGEYAAKITKSDYKENSKKTGHFASLQFTIVQGEFKGRHVFANLNLDNPSDVSVEMAERELATICAAIGKKSIKDTKELHDKVMAIKVKQVDEETNEIRMYKEYEENDGDEENDEEVDEVEEEEEEEEEEENDGDEEITVDSVKALAKRFKKEVGDEELKEMLGDFDISSVLKIKKLSEEDLESLSEELSEQLK